jgi:NAD-dependent dihydropyrimidine dehydrogenase PreA subunit
MSKLWYPVIDYVKCTECGTCIDFCSHGVYDKTKAPSPVVTQSDGCIQGCHGCGNTCPVGAVEYVGDNTGWVPPNGEKEETAECGCNCEGGFCCG